MSVIYSDNMEKTNSLIYYNDNNNIHNVVRRMKNEKFEDLEESFYVCDLSEVINNYNNWKECFPRVTPFYAVKCNDNVEILAVLANVGASFDCASKNEIEKIKSLRVESDRIIYANPTKQISNIKYARDVGVRKIVFDNAFELHKIREHYPEAELILRIRCDSDSTLYSLGLKFGCDTETEALNLLKLSQLLNLKVIGISFHVGILCKNPTSYALAIKLSKEIFDLAASIGISINLLDIGGGYEREVSKLRKLAVVINSSLDKYFPGNDVRIIAEPGNYMTSTSMSLITKIHSIREYQSNEVMEIMYYINAGIFNAFCFRIHGEEATLPECLEVDDRTPVDCSIWGQTCDSYDMVMNNIRLPKQKIEDILIFRNMGAYTNSISSTFNGFPIPEVYYFLKSQHKNFGPANLLGQHNGF